MRTHGLNVSKVLTALAMGVLGASLVGVPAVTAVMSAPEPDAIPRRWQLDFKPGALRMAKIEKADGSVASYLYMTYRVTNKTGEDVLFAPSFELADGQGGVFRSGRGVPLDVASKLQKDLNNPFLEDQISILGMLLRGDENAKDGIVIWPFSDMQASEITVYAAGFSGEVKMAPAFPDPKSGKLVSAPLYKTYMARFKTGGDMTSRGTDAFTPYETTWIMR